MIWSTFLNGALYWVMIVTVCSTMGNLETDLATATGYPFIQVFYNATGSKAATTAMAVFVLLVFMACTLTTVATASRQLYAFARDQGLPCSGWLAQVRWDIPVNATLVTCAFVVCLSLINLYVLVPIFLVRVRLADFLNLPRVPGAPQQPSTT